MSDQNKARGHELEGSRPIKLFIGLAIAATAMGLGVVFAVQMSYGARNDQKWAAAERGSEMLRDHKARVAGELEGVEEVAASVAADPNLLRRGEEPDGFVHPDKTKGVGRWSAGLTPPPAPKPAPKDPEAGGSDGTAEEAAAGGATEGGDAAGAEEAAGQ